MDMSILEAQSDVLFGNVAGWEQSVLNRIAKRINAVGKMSVADVKALNNIAFVKQDMKEITKDLAKMTKMNVSQIEKIYGDTLAQQHLENSPLYDYRNKNFVPFADNKELQAIVRAYSKTTAGNMVNLSKIGANNLGMLDENGKFKPIERFYTEALDKAVMQVASGSTDFHTAMRDVIQAMGGSGIRVSYPGTDITRRLDTAVRQSLLWGAKQASIEYNEKIGEELGCDGIEVDWHSFPRPSHEFMQGKQYVLGKSRTINGKYYESADKALEALNDYGCLHYKTPIICGISEPRYSEQELADLNKSNAQTFDIDGKQMTGYDAKQAMRRLETGVREQKTTREAARNAGDKVLADRCTAKIKAYQAKYNEISEKTGIAPSPKRMSIPKGLNSVKSVDFLGNGGIIKSEEKLSELGKFKSRLRNDKNVDDGYYSVIKERFSHGTNDAKRVFNKYIPTDSIADAQCLDVPHYDSTNKKIYMNFVADSNNERGNGTTYFHEHGHMLDDVLGNISHDNEFRYLLERDRMEYARNYGKKNGLKTWDKVDTAISKELNSMRKHSGVSDIYDGLTHGNVRGIAGHPPEYWKKEGNLESEAFAHMFASQFDDVRYKEMKKYFPKSLEWFEKKLKEV